MDYYDRRRIEEKAEEVARETQDVLRESMGRVEDSLNAGTARQLELLKAFNKMAGALETLAQEVRGLREDLDPELPKRKLAAPAKPDGVAP